MVILITMRHRHEDLPTFSHQLSDYCMDKGFCLSKPFRIFFMVKRMNSILACEFSDSAFDIAP